MKHGLKIMIATLAVSSVLLTACGKSGGGGDSGATNAAPAAPAWNSSFPAGFVGNGTYQGQVALTQTSLGAYYQMAALTQLCGGYGCSQGSYLNIRVNLRGNGGYGGTVPVGTVAGQSIGGFALSSANGVFQRSMVFTTGSPAGFSLAVGLWNQSQNAQPPAAGEPSITINGQFTDQTMSVLNVQVVYTSAQTGAVQIAAGQIFGNSNGGYGQPGYGYGQPGYGYGYGGGTVPVGVGGGYYYYYGARR